MSAPRPGPAQRVRMVEVAEYGPEPIGEEQSLAIQSQYLTTARGGAGPHKPNYRSLGDPAWSAMGDLGPIQAFTKVRTVPSYNTNARGFSSALPSTSGGSSVQDQLASLGI